MTWTIDGVPVPARRCSASQRLSGREETLYRRRLERWRATVRARFLDIDYSIATTDVVFVRLQFVFDLGAVVPDMLPYAEVVLDALVKTRRVTRSQIVSVGIARVSLPATPGVMVEVGKSRLF